MASNQVPLQKLQEELRKILEQTRSTQTSVQQLKAAKKENDVTKRRHDAADSLKAMQNSVMQFQEYLKTNLSELEESLDQKEEQDTKKAETNPRKGHVGQMSPEEQARLYEAKAARVTATQAQNAALKRELELTHKRQELLDARFARNQDVVGSETWRAAHALEAKLRRAELKIKGLEDELRKSQQTTLTYRQKYEDSLHQNEQNTGQQETSQQRGKPTTKDKGNKATSKEDQKKEKDAKGKSMSKEDQKKEKDAKGKSSSKEEKSKAEQEKQSKTAAKQQQSKSASKEQQATTQNETRNTKVKPAPQQEQSFIGPNTNINDVVRKNECLLEKNEEQRQEIRRLQSEVNHLTLVAKTADADRYTTLARLGTNYCAKHVLHKRYSKLKDENAQLSKSLTQQTERLIEVKKQSHKAQSQEQWTGLMPVAPHGGRDRFLSVRQKENVHQPRYMFPVESYADTSAA